MAKSKEFRKQWKDRQIDQVDQDLARQYAVQEFVSAGIYKSLLGNHANEVTLTKNNESLSLVSSIPVEAQKLEATLADGQKTEGFEEIMATCDLLRNTGYGDVDYFAVQDGNTLTYGNYEYSFTSFFTDFSSMVSEKYVNLSRYPTPDLAYCHHAIENGKMSFNIKKYGQVLNQMLEQYDEKQIEDIIDQRLDKLQQAGFEFKHIKVFPIGKDIKLLNDKDELKKFYKEQMKETITLMKDVVKSIEIISKFDDMPPEFMNGGWLEAFATSETKDPVAYAAHNNIKIDGKDAIQWAYNNNYKIKISNEEKRIYGDQWPETSLEPLEYMKRKGLELSSSAKEGAKKSYSQDKATAESVMVLADSFAEEATKGILRTEQIEKFYDEVLFNLQKEKYLTRKQVDSIKKTELYRTQVDNTAKLMDEHMPGLEGKDKLYYQVARFTKAIGLPEISDHCLKQITPAKLEKIKIIETALSHGIKKFSLDIKNSIGKDNERLGKVIAKIPEKHETRSR